MIKNKKFFLLLIILTLVIFIGASYAFVMLSLTGTKTYSILGGELSLILDERNNQINIGDDDTIPVADYEGLNQDGYNFKIINNGKTDTNYYIYIDDNPEKTMSDSAIRYALSKEDETSPFIDDFQNLNNRLLTSGVIKKKETISYNLKIWIGLNATNQEVVDKTFSVKLRVVGEQILDLVYQDDSGAATPILKDELIPITIKNGVAHKASIHEKWYDYDENMWANVVIVKNDKFLDYKNAKTGTEIKEEDIESYFVWIPKFDYQIFNVGDYTEPGEITNTTQEINVRFSKNNTKNNDTECTYPIVNNQAVAGAGFDNCSVGKWMTHPAFTTMNVDGFWVGKFETGYLGATTQAAAMVNSVDSSKIIVKPNVYSWRSIEIDNAFKNSYDYKRNLDSHMMKNTEWGAMAYLSASKYGYKDQISEENKRTTAIINNNSFSVTGFASLVEPTLEWVASSVEGNRFENVRPTYNGTYTVNYLNNLSQLASTTGNYYGIYDISGGSWEYTMGYTISDSNDSSLYTINSLYPDFFTNSNYYKYWDKYTAVGMYDYNNRILGDATAEMGPFNLKSSWYSDVGIYINETNPWFVRSGAFTYGSGSGIFTYYFYEPVMNGWNTYRIVLSPTE